MPSWVEHPVLTTSYEIFYKLFDTQDWCYFFSKHWTIESLILKRERNHLFIICYKSVSDFETIIGKNSWIWFSCLRKTFLKCSPFLSPHIFRRLIEEVWWKREKSCLVEKVLKTWQASSVSLNFFTKNVLRAPAFSIGLWMKWIETRKLA